MCHFPSSLFLGVGQNFQAVVFFMSEGLLFNIFCKAMSDGDDSFSSRMSPNNFFFLVWK